VPLRITRFETTPNPNALRCAVEPAPTDKPRAYRARSDAAAAGDALALRLFDAGPISSVLIHTTFITAVKTPDAKWPPLKKALKSAIEHPA
jgi:hypothetical protein